MPLMNWKVELKLKWRKHCILATGGTDNYDANSNNIIFTIKDTNLYVPVVTFSAKKQPKTVKISYKGFER